MLVEISCPLLCQDAALPQQRVGLVADHLARSVTRRAGPAQNYCALHPAAAARTAPATARVAAKGLRQGGDGAADIGHRGTNVHIAIDAQLRRGIHPTDWIGQKCLACRDLDVAALPFEGIGDDLAVLQDDELRVNGDIAAGGLRPPPTVAVTRLSRSRTMVCARTVISPPSARSRIVVTVLCSLRKESVAVIVILPAFPAPVLSAATMAPAVSWTMRAWRVISPPRLRPDFVVKMPLFAPESVTMSVAVTVTSPHGPRRRCCCR